MAARVVLTYRDYYWIVYWIVDLEGRGFEAYTLAGEAYQSAIGAEGSRTVSPPPFPELRLDLASLWS